MMLNLNEILSNGEARVTIQVSGEDLLEFAHSLTALAEERARMAQEAKASSLYLSKKEVLALLGVCDTTLWLWGKSGYLVPLKAGRKVLYRKSDVDRILGAKGCG